MKRILSLQGGGCLGKGQAAIMPIIEHLACNQIALSFDLIAGTSVGCINGGCLAAGIPTATINSFFDKYAPTIFKANPYRLAISRLFRTAKYAPDALEAALKEILGDRTLTDCKTPFIATAVDMNSGRNVYFQSYGTSYTDEDDIVLCPDSGIKLWEVMRASAAAQSYFPGFQWKTFCFWDGGSTGANAPDMLALTEAKQLFNDAWLVSKMLSLGSGRRPWAYAGIDMSNPNFRLLLEATIEMVYSCAEATAVWQAHGIVGDANHVRLNPTLPSKFAIDDASAPTLTAIANTWTTDALGNAKLKTFFLD